MKSLTRIFMPLAAITGFWLVPGNAEAQVVCDGIPDAFDYLCTPVDYQFTEGATLTAVTSDDQMSQALPLGFTFSYYDVDYTQVYISSNGFLTFLPGQSAGCCSGQRMPSNSNPNGVVAALWTDLNPSRGGTVRYGTVGEQPNRRFVASWEGVPYHPSDGANIFQIVLFENGDIEIHHGNVGNTTRTISMGIENADGSVGVQLRNGVGGAVPNSGYRVARTTFRADAGGTYNVDEGTAEIMLSAARSRGEIVTYLWDLDGDGEYDDAEGVEVPFDPSDIDGPGQTTVGVQVTDINEEVSTDQATINVLNVAPEIVSEPNEVANVGQQYRYILDIEDPGAQWDPLSFRLVEGPPGMTLNIEGVVTWTPFPNDLDQTYSVEVEIDDNDGGFGGQSWQLTVFAPDLDGDNVPDADDNCVRVPNPEQLDNDNDARGDLCDDDDDNDGVEDLADNCPRLANPEQLNNDNDDAGDACDADDDNDFVPDEEDNCPLTTNPGQVDSDDDGIGDACANDEDSDRVPNDVDNCPQVRNTNQLDTDDDGQGDACDDDDDNDGLLDGQEANRMTNPLEPDTDNDGLTDGQEVNEYGTNPLERDADRDLLPDGDEINAGTNPNDPDTDDDDLDDGQEVALGTNPLEIDTDEDGLFDGEEILIFLTNPMLPDTDGGGVDDGQEVLNTTDPNNPNDDFPSIVPPDDDNNDANNDANNAPNNSPDPPDDNDPPDDGQDGDDDGGSCATAPGKPAGTSALWVLMGALVLLRRRRRQRS